MLRRLTKNSRKVNVVNKMIRMTGRMTVDEVLVAIVAIFMHDLCMKEISM